MNNLVPHQARVNLDLGLIVKGQLQKKTWFICFITSFNFQNFFKSLVPHPVSLSSPFSGYGRSVIHHSFIFKTCSKAKVKRSAGKTMVNFLSWLRHIYRKYILQKWPLQPSAVVRPIYTHTPSTSSSFLSMFWIKSFTWLIFTTNRPQCPLCYTSLKSYGS